MNNTCILYTAQTWILTNHIKTIQIVEKLLIQLVIRLVLIYFPSLPSYNIVSIMGVVTAVVVIDF